MPDWYLVMQAAKYLGIPPWELEQAGVFWLWHALGAMSAEGRAREAVEKRERAKWH